jgi:GPH family glycoside/pentoside/hexuronide:cation symporter
MKSETKDEHIPSVTADEDKIPVVEKSVYGLGAPTMMLVNHIIEYQVQQVLVFGLGMSPGLKGIIVMIYRIWDAFTDPLVGWLSDNIRTPYGRRRPFMFVGVLLMATVLPFVWQFNETWDLIFIAIWFTVFGMIASTSSTLFNIPYYTLRMEMTPDYNERTSINVYASIINKLFALLGPWIWKMTQHPFFTGQDPTEDPNTLLGIRSLSIYFAALIVILGLLPTFVTKERYYKNVIKQKKEPLLKSLKMTFTSIPFRMMLLLIFTVNMEGLVNGMGGYLSLYYVFDGDKSMAATYTGIAGTIGVVLGVISIPFFGWLANHFGKERSLLINTGASILISLSIFFCYNPEYPWLTIIPAVLNGVIVAGFWTVIPSMKADIVDDDELITGERREGSFESMFSWFFRATGSIFLGLSGFVVIVIGFDIKTATDQPDGVFTAMMYLMALIPALLGILQFIVIMKWPLTRGRMDEIRRDLEDRRGKIKV